MREFILNNYYYLNEGVIIMAALVGLLTFNKFKQTKVKYFIYFLIYVLVIELIGWYPSLSYYNESFKWIDNLTKGTILEENYLWYGIFWKMGSALFISFYFNKVLRKDIFKNIIKYLTYLFIGMCIIYLLFFNSTYYKGESYLINFSGVLIIVLSAIFYLVEVLMSEKVISFYKSVHFYIASVFFIFFLIKTPITFFQIYYSTSDWNFVFLRDEIILFCNIFMYLTFAFALIKCKPKDL